MSACMSAVSAGISEVLIKYTGKYVKIYFIMKITYHPFFYHVGKIGLYGFDNSFSIFCRFF